LPLLRLTAAVIDLDQFCARARLVKIQTVTAGSSLRPCCFRGGNSEEEKLGVLEELKALDEHRAKILTRAKLAALEKAEDAIAELSKLGFHYSLIENAHTEMAKGPRNERPQASAPFTDADVKDKGRARIESPFSGFDQSLPGS
jgi:hypothetical protein